MSSLGRRADDRVTSVLVGFWPFSDLQACPLSRYFRGTSGHPSMIVPNVNVREYTP
jgi:hypothetical protein